jgi:hypothetical protein
LIFTSITAAGFQATLVSLQSPLQPPSNLRMVGA